MKIFFVFVALLVTISRVAFSQTNNLETLGITGFKQETIDQQNTSPYVTARLCGTWHTNTIGLNSIEATLENSVEAAQFGEDNSNGKFIGQVISCWGSGQHL